MPDAECSSTEQNMTRCTHRKYFDYTAKSNKDFAYKVIAGFKEQTNKSSEENWRKALLRRHKKHLTFFRLFYHRFEREGLVSQQLMVNNPFHTDFTENISEGCYSVQ